MPNYAKPLPYDLMLCQQCYVKHVQYYAGLFVYMHSMQLRVLPDGVNDLTSKTYYKRVPDIIIQQLEGACTGMLYKHSLKLIYKLVK